MCHNPTTDGPLEWEGHEMVAYVDITPPVRTQAEHTARLTGLVASIEKEIAYTKKELEDDPEHPEKQELEDHIFDKETELEYINVLMPIPLPVEDLSKIYYVGINSVPKDLVVDVVLSAGCPLDSRNPSNFKPGSVQADLLTAVKTHLRPDGELYLVGGDWNLYDKTYHDAFAPYLKYSREEVQTITSDYYEARGTFPDPSYAVLVRKPNGGRRRTRKRHSKRKSTRRHK